jgi:hypothetical protein
MIFGQLTAVGLWNLAKYLVVTIFFSLWFEILTWFLVCECIVISYQSCLNFVPIEWFWANLRTWTFNFGQIFSCHHFISLCFEILTWFLVFGITMMSDRSSLAFVILSLWLRELKKGETFASLLNIHGVGWDIRVVSTHLVLNVLFHFLPQISMFIRVYSFMITSEQIKKISP